MRLSVRMRGHLRTTKRLESSRLGQLDERGAIQMSSSTNCASQTGAQTSRTGLKLSQECSVGCPNQTPHTVQCCISVQTTNEVGISAVETCHNWVGYHPVTRSSWLNCALRDDEAVYWVSKGHYEAVAVGNWWYWVSRGHSCLYILHKVEIWKGVTHAWLTDWQTLKDRATQLLIKYKSGALVTQSKKHCRETWSRLFRNPSLSWAWNSFFLSDCWQIDLYDWSTRSCFLYFICLSLVASCV